MAVNGQITDSVTQVNVKVVGESPALAMGNLLMTTSQALGNSAAGETQQASLTMEEAATTMKSVSVQDMDSLLSTGSTVISKGAEETLEKDD